MAQGDLNPPEFFKPLSIQPGSGDLTGVIFQAAQLGIQKREQERQATQGLVNTFLSIAKLNQEKTRVEMEHLVASATLENQQDKTKLQEDKFKFDKKQALKPATFQGIDPLTGGPSGDIVEAPADTKFGVLPTPRAESKGGLDPASFKGLSELRETTATRREIVSDLQTIKGSLSDFRLVGVGNKLIADLTNRDPELSQAYKNFTSNAVRILRAIGDVGNAAEKEQARALEKGISTIGFSTPAQADVAIKNFQTFFRERSDSLQKLLLLKGIDPEVIRAFTEGPTTGASQTPTQGSGGNPFR